MSSVLQARDDIRLALNKALTGALDPATSLSAHGRVVEALGTLVRGVGVSVQVGHLCELRTSKGTVLSEVIGFSGESFILSPYGTLQGISSDTTIVPLRHAHKVAVGKQLLGRVLNGFGEPIDKKGPLDMSDMRSVEAEPPDSLDRPLISDMFPTGVRTIDGLLTIGKGQRLGIFAPAGGGKSTLMGMVARGSQDSVNVIALIGERGREVLEFIEHSLGSEGLARSVLVIATSDKPAIERIKAAFVATTLAEYFRSTGSDVLFMMDSITRFARALREVGLAGGEPPTRRGFPPSVFATLPRLLERTGLDSNGSITALYTVLLEGEDTDDPIGEEVRSILDGHIILSRKLAASGHYPAIDVLRSASRVMDKVITPEHLESARKFRELIAKYEEIELLIQVGEYKAGNDQLADEAVSRKGNTDLFLRQATSDLFPPDRTISILNKVVE